MISGRLALCVGGVAIWIAVLCWAAAFLTRRFARQTSFSLGRKGVFLHSSFLSKGAVSYEYSPCAACVSLEGVHIPLKGIASSSLPITLIECSISTFRVTVSIWSILWARFPSVTVEVHSPSLLLHSNGACTSVEAAYSAATPRSQLLRDVAKVLWPAVGLNAHLRSLFQVVTGRSLPYIMHAVGKVTIRIENAALSLSTSDDPMAETVSGCEEKQCTPCMLICHVGCLHIGPERAKKQQNQPSDGVLHMQTSISGVGLTCEQGHASGHKIGKLLQQWSAKVCTEVTQKRSGGASLQISNEVEMKSLLFQCNDVTYSILVHLMLLIQKHQARLAHGCYRPKTPVSADARAWWHYAGRSVLYHVCRMPCEPKWPVHQLRKLPTFVRYCQSGRLQGDANPIVQ
jgi:hypothetical protein